MILGPAILPLSLGVIALIIGSFYYIKSMGQGECDPVPSGQSYNAYGGATGIIIAFISFFITFLMVFILKDTINVLKVAT
jgi:hypothetical protein